MMMGFFRGGGWVGGYTRGGGELGCRFMGWESGGGVLGFWG